MPAGPSTWLRASGAPRYSAKPKALISLPRSWTAPAWHCPRRHLHTGMLALEFACFVLLRNVDGHRLLGGPAASVDHASAASFGFQTLGAEAVEGVTSPVPADQMPRQVGACALPSGSTLQEPWVLNRAAAKCLKNAALMYSVLRRITTPRRVLVGKLERSQFQTRLAEDHRSSRSTGQSAAPRLNVHPA